MRLRSKIIKTIDTLPFFPTPKIIQKNGMECQLFDHLFKIEYREFSSAYVEFVNIIYEV